MDRRLPGSGRALPREWALQVPSDYVQALRTALPPAMGAAGADVIGIATDFTARTMVPTIGDGTPWSEVEAPAADASVQGADR